MKYDQCCDNDPSYVVIYSCGPEPNQRLLVCDFHFDNDPSWNQHIISVKKIEAKIEVAQ